MAQQGHGRPIIAAKVRDHRIVAVGSTVHWLKDCETFPDFLDHYIKLKLGSEWGAAELAKPLADRHPLMQLFDAYTQYRKANSVADGVVSTADVTGSVMCFTGLAYGLYLLDHNAELQERLVRRLKDRANFQGAFYEVAIARVLIRAGFRLELEDETDPALKHCEFSATSKTGKKFWVEAKMRSITGLMGKTAMDGGSDAKPLRKLVPHLNAAFEKPAADDRLVFIDINTDDGLNGDPALAPWRIPAVDRLEEYERNELKAGESAYVFVTNLAYHRDLHCKPRGSMLPYGVGCDFNKVLPLETLRDRYRREQRHREAHDIVESFQRDLTIPSTFDGSLPSETFGHRKRPLIGQRYLFEGEGHPRFVGVLEAASVNEPKNEMNLAVRTDDGRIVMVTEPMSADELFDYQRNRDAYFGDIDRAVNDLGNDPYVFFKWSVDSMRGAKRQKLIEWMSPHVPVAELQTLSDEDLLLRYCEGITYGAVRDRRKAA